MAIGRKNSLFLGSDAGGNVAATLSCLMASAKASQAEPFANVRDFVVRFSDKRLEDLSELLSDEWLNTRPKARRRWS